MFSPGGEEGVGGTAVEEEEELWLRQRGARSMREHGGA